MTNAKYEFIIHTRDRPRVYCAIVYKHREDFGSMYGANEAKVEDTAAILHVGYTPEDAAILHVGYTPEDYNQFLELLDFDYDDGYGSQQIYGYIWYDDMTWSHRAEYDGSEWWSYNSVPEIPIMLWRNTKKINHGDQ